jgi:hypothetical protein
MRSLQSATLLPLIALLFSIALSGCAVSTPSVQTVNLSPFNATYRIDNRQITLKAGQASIEQGPGIASRTEVQVFGEPVRGDLNGDGVADAALLLIETTGGSGTFYYVAAAINRNGSFEGTDAIFLGDRISPQSLSIGHSLVIVDYLDRPPKASMATPPVIEHSTYLLFDNQGFREIPVEENEAIIAGEVIVGHEVRSLQPCGEPEARWILGNSPALLSLQAAYHLAMSDAGPYTPLLMITTGREENSPPDGFGTDYVSAIRINRVVKALPGKSCYE